MIDAGWAKEIKVRNGAPVWRKDKASGESYTLKLSAKGRQAAAAKMEAAGGEKMLSVPAAARKAAPQAPAGQTAAPFEAMSSAPDDSHGEVASTAIRAPRPTSKLGCVLGMLVAEAGATIGELMAATGWLEHTTRAALTGLRHRGYELSLTTKERDRVSVYRIVAHGEGAAQ